MGEGGRGREGGRVGGRVGGTEGGREGEGEEEREGEKEGGDSHVGHVAFISADSCTMYDGVAILAKIGRQLN